MEEQYNKKDNLEEYLQNSLDGYEEQPPQSVWSGIDSDLDKEDSAPAKPPYMQKWWLGIAAVFVLCVFTCQQLYFNSRISDLEMQVERSEKNYQEQTEQHDNAAGETTINRNPNTSKSINTLSAEEAPQQQNQMRESDGDTHHPAFPSTIQDSRNAGNSTPKVQDPDPDQPEVSPLPNELPNPVSDETSPIVQAPAKSRMASTIPSLLVGLLDKHTGLPDRSITPSEIALSHPQSTSGIKLGVFSMPVFSRTLVKDKTVGPGPLQKRLSRSYKSTGSSWYNGVTIERAISNNFSLISGLALQLERSDASHTARFLFSERKPPLGGHPDQHRFTYNLNTGTESVGVEIRMEEQTPGMGLPPMGELEIAVNTTQKYTRISLPLLVQYSQGNEKIRFVSKAGFLANLLVRDKFEFSKVSTDNSFLRITSDPVSKVNSSRESASLDLLVSAGVQTSLTPKVSLGLEPSYIFGTNKTGQTREAQTQRHRLGLNANLSILF